jgi:hypothetical protein
MMQTLNTQFMEVIMARAFTEETRAAQMGNPAVTQISNSQSVDRKVLLLLKRNGAQTIEGLTMLTGIGWGQVFLSVDRMSRTGTVSLKVVYPSEYLVSVVMAGGSAKVINLPILQTVKT